MPISVARDGTVPLGVLLAHAAPALPLAAAFLSLQVFVPSLYATATGQSLTTIGVVLLLARLWDTVTDPVVGYFSDRTPAALGRRRLWVVLGTPLVCLGVAALFSPPAETGLGYLLLWTVVVYAAGTMVIVPLNAWGAELSPDYQQRSRISGARVAFGLAGTLAALIGPAALGLGDARDVDQALDFMSDFVVVALVLAVLVSVLVVPDRAEVRLPRETLRHALDLLKQASPFRQLITAFLLNGIANAIPATLFLLFVTHVLAVPQLAGLLLVTYFGAAIVSVPLWVHASRRLGKDRAWRLGMAVSCAFFMWAPFLGAGDVLPFVVIIVGTGLATGGDLILPAALQADLIDWDAHRSGYRRPGLFFALWGTATKLAFALAVGLAFPLLDLAGFEAAGSNEGFGLTALALIYGALPIVLKFGALLLMDDYQLTQDAHAAIRAELERRPQAG
ncbi:MAG: MFS transporter [Gammaproteobacteria bacterium]